LKNVFLRERTARDINGLVAKVLRDLGNPEPPLNLGSVRELLRLDRQYDSSTEDGALREVAHRLTIAGKQVLARPALLLDVIKKWDLRALFIPDGKRILIDTNLPEPKQRWSEGHISIDALLSYSAVCGTGLDTIPLPGDITADQLSLIIGDMASLAFKWRKPLSARLLPVLGKGWGEMTEFDDPFLVNAKLQSLDVK